MKRFALLLPLLLALVLGTCEVCPAQSPWYTVYYATWNQTTLNGSSWQGEKLGQPPDQVDWTGITHVVHFGNGNVVSSPPYSLFATDSTEITYGANGGKTDYQSQLVSVCHSKGIKVVLSIQAVDPSGLHAALASQSSADVFAEWLTLYARRHGYDGFEIDWEGESPNVTLANRLILTLRAHLNKWYGPTRALILLSPGLSDYNSYAPAVCDTAVDQYNPQLYAQMWTPNNTNHTWHTCAVYPGTAPSGELDAAIDGWTDGSNKGGYMQAWVTAGHDPAKMGMLLPTFGYFCLGTDQLFGAESKTIGHNGSTTVTQNAMLTGLLTVGGVRTWDATRQMAYISGTATAAYGAAEYGGVAKGQKFFATYADPQWVQAVVQYYKTKTYNGKQAGGLALYSLTEDFDPSKLAGQGRNIIHDAMRDALAGIVTPPPQPAPTGTFSPSVSSLPAGGGQVVLSWTSLNALTASISPGGSVALSGSQTVQVVTSTTFTLTLAGAGGTKTYSASVTVAATPPPPPVSGCDSLGWFAKGVASVKCPPAIHDTVTITKTVTVTLHDTVTITKTVPAKWDSVSYSYVNGQAFPAAAVVLLKGSQVIARSYNTSTQKVTVYFLKPNITP